MLLLGLLLLVAAGALTGGLLVDNTADSKAEVFGYSLPHLSIGQLFGVGVVTGFLATLGLGLLLAGLRRSGRRRRQQRQELKAKRQREDDLKQENTRLAQELEQQRMSTPPMSTPPLATSVGPTANPTAGATSAEASGLPLDPQATGRSSRGSEESPLPPDAPGGQDPRGLRL